MRAASYHRRISLRDAGKTQGKTGTVVNPGPYHEIPPANPAHEALGEEL
jgi:hypothetical protein